MPWPLGGAGDATLYLVLYVVTLAAHAALIGYVIGGAGWAAIAALRRRGDEPVAAAARDWLPFYLGAAITAGVAPLLFVQVLYPDRFYTANLLLGPRWLAVVPALAIGFYALYVFKSKLAARRVVRVGSIATALGCFAFVAWSWTENHRLMLDQPAWHAFHAAGRWLYDPAGAAPRWAMWIAAALPMFAVIAAWQIGDAGGRARRGLAIAALIGVAVSSALAFVVHAGATEAARAGFDRALPWVVVVAIARGVELVGWVAIAVRPEARAPLLVVTGAAAATLVSAVIVREATRIHVLGPIDPRTSNAGGLVLFAIAVVVAIAAIVTIVRLVRAADNKDSSKLDT
jgi:hypothetical protein